MNRQIRNNLPKKALNKHRDINHSSKLRVLISGCLPPPIGGMSAFYETLLNSSLRQKINLSFVQTSTSKRKFETSGRLSVSNTVWAVADCWRFLWAVITSHPQLTHIGTAFGISFVKNSLCIVISKLLGCKVLLHPHCSFAALFGDRSPRWQWYFKWVISLVHGVIVISKEWNELLSILPNCKVFELPNAIKIDYFYKVAETQLSGKQKNSPVQILYLGYLGKAKGSFDLLDTVKMAKAAKDNLHFVLVGSELVLGELKRLQEKVQADNLESYIDLMPPVFGAEKLDFFRRADIFVYPSYNEGMPMAVIEAMACALPVVATRVGGLPDLIEDQVTGLLVDPGRPEQIIDALHKLMSNSSLRDKIKKNSFQAVRKQFDIENRVNQLVDIYELVLSTEKSIYHHAKLN